MGLKKEVLVISEYFAPLNSIASIRFTKVLKYLSRKNKYHFVVIARKSDDKADAMLQRELDEMSSSVSVFYIDILDNAIDNLRNRRKDSYAYRDTSSSTNVLKFKPYKTATPKERMYKVANTAKYIFNEKLFAARGIALIESLDIDFSCVISSYGDAGSHLLALKYLNKHPQIRWIADYRDPAITYYRPPLFHPFFHSILNNTRKKAYAVTGVNEVSMGKCARLTKSHVIINGFDREDLTDTGNSEIHLGKEKLHICYTGRIYGGKSDARPLLKAIHNLDKAGRIAATDFQIDYAGSNFDLFSQQASEYDLTGILVNHGYVQRQDALAIQKQSQILLVLSWNDEDEEDVLTGKFMEYLMSERTILAIVTGNKSDCSISRILKDSQAGYCYEAARGTGEYEMLERYLAEMYHTFQKSGEVIYPGNRDALKQFDYKNIAEQFEQLMMEAGT